MAKKYDFKASELPISPITLTTTLENPTGGWRSYKPVIKNKSAPCTMTCPTKVLIPHFIDSLVKGDLDMAANLLHRNNPFPSITGRLCHAPCELSCNRGKYDDPVSIKQLERFVGDYYLDKKGKPPRRETGKRVAIIGGGLAGLSAAYYLRSKGHEVVVYDRNPEVGGYLRYAVPEYRLPLAILEAEVAALEKMGVKFITGVEVGKDVPFEELRTKYDAVLVAHGSSAEVKPDFPGADLLKSGRELLKEVRAGKRPEASGKVAVVGDGGTAFEVARVLKRLGADPFVIYPSGKITVPFHEKQILTMAEEEGIKFFFGEIPVKAQKMDGMIELTVAEAEDGEPVAGTEHGMTFNEVFHAYEGRVETSFLPDEIVEGGYVKASRKDAKTSVEGVFAAGEAVLGPSPVANIVYSGRVAAASIDAYLKGRTYTPETFPEVVGYDRIITDYFPPAPRVPELKLSVEERVKSLTREEVIGYTQELAMKEAERCFSCGFCNACGNCYVFCPDYTIKWVHGRPKVDYEYCKGCGICSEECPRGVIDMVREREF